MCFPAVVCCSIHKSFNCQLGFHSHPCPIMWNSALLSEWPEFMAVGTLLFPQPQTHTSTLRNTVKTHKVRYTQTQYHFTSLQRGKATTQFRLFCTETSKLPQSDTYMYTTAVKLCQRLSALHPSK